MFGITFFRHLKEVEIYGLPIRPMRTRRHHEADGNMCRVVGRQREEVKVMILIRTHLWLCVGVFNRVWARQHIRLEDGVNERSAHNGIKIPTKLPGNWTRSRAGREEVKESTGRRGHPFCKGSKRECGWEDLRGSGIVGEGERGMVDVTKTGNASESWQ